MGEIGENQAPAAVPERAEAGEAQNAENSSLRRSSRQSKPSDRYKLDFEDSTDLNLCYYRARNKRAKYASERHERSQDQMFSIEDTTLAKIKPLLAPSQEALTQAEALAAKRVALLNPPRREDSLETNSVLTPVDPVQQAISYNSAVTQLHGTLSTLRYRVNKYDAHISAKDLETIHDQFEAFMSTHPLFRNGVNTPYFPPPDTAQPHPYGYTHAEAPQPYSGPLPVGHSVIDSRRLPAVHDAGQLPSFQSGPLAPGNGTTQQAAPQVPVSLPPRIEQTYSGVSAPQGSEIAPEDLAAIARARAAVMAASYQETSTLNDSATGEIISMLTSMGQQQAGLELLRASNGNLNT